MADKVFFWLDDHPMDGQEDRPIYKLQNWLGEFLAGKPKNLSWLARFCQTIHDRHERTVKVRIDYHDVWNAAGTMSLIMVPLLKELKKTKHGSPDIELGDVPRNLWPVHLSSSSNNYTDDTIHARWEWVLDEIIWALEQVSSEDGEGQFYDHSEANDESDDLMVQIGKIKIDQDGLNAWHERKSNGLRLLGKYFETLWD